MKSARNMASVVPARFFLLSLCLVHLSLAAEGGSVESGNVAVVHDETEGDVLNQPTAALASGASEEREGDVKKPSTTKLSRAGVPTSSTVTKLLRTSGVLLVSIMLVKLAGLFMMCFTRSEARQAGSTRRALSSSLWNTEDLCDLLGGKSDLSSDSEAKALPFVDGGLSPPSLQSSKVLIALAVVAFAMAIAIRSADAMPLEPSVSEDFEVDFADGEEGESGASRSKRSAGWQNVEVDATITCYASGTRCRVDFPNASDFYYEYQVKVDPRKSRTIPCSLFFPREYTNVLGNYKRDRRFQKFLKQLASRVRENLHSGSTTERVRVPLLPGVQKSAFNL